MSTRSSKYQRHAMLALLCLPIAVAGNGLGCRQVAGIEEPPTCDAASDCPEPESACLEASCVEGACAYEAVAAGSPAPGDEPGDCKKSVCDAAGSASVEDDATDSEDGDPCTIDSCEGGVAQHQPATEVPCYTGPSGTEGEGNCQPGLAQCVDGQMGECVGEVLPADETCDEPGDEDCDGMANEGGIGCDCEAGDTQPCYTGDPLSEGIGTCTAGTQTCNPNGMGFGECTGEVTPAAADDCATTADDEDCNGLPDCQGRTEWYLGTLSDDSSIDKVIVAPDGSLVIGGHVTGVFAVGGQSGTTSLRDAFVAKLDASTGAVQWLTKMTGNCQEMVNELGVTPSGDIILAGSMPFNPSPCSVNGVAMALDHFTLSRHFLVRLGSNGSILSTNQLDMHYVHSIAVTATNVYIAGERHDPAVPADVQYTTNKYDLSGVEVASNWKRVELVKALYADGANVWTVGEFTGTEDFGAFNLTSAGGKDIFVVQRSASGLANVATRFGGTGDDTATAIYSDSNGVYLAGSFASPTLSLGDDTLTNADSTSDAFLLRMNTSLVPQASLHVSGLNQQELTSISASGPGISIGGRSNGVLVIPGFPDMPTVGNHDTYVARLLPDTLQPVWRRAIGGASQDFLGSVAGGPGGETYYAAEIVGPVDMDDTVPGIENAGETSAEGYVMRLAQ